MLCSDKILIVEKNLSLTLLAITIYFLQTFWKYLTSYFSQGLLFPTPMLGWYLRGVFIPVIKSLDFMVSNYRMPVPCPGALAPLVKSTWIKVYRKGNRSPSFISARKQISNFRLRFQFCQSWIYLISYTIPDMQKVYFCPGTLFWLKKCPGNLFRKIN